jgi:hypothetical protein
VALLWQGELSLAGELDLLAQRMSQPLPCTGSVGIEPGSPFGVPGVLLGPGLQLPCSLGH